MSPHAIRLEGVSVAYGRHTAVRAVTGSFARASLTAITGPNGAGKTTLLKALLGELPLAAGRIDRGGLTACDIAYLPQIAEIDRSFPISVGDVVSLGAWRETGALGPLGGAAAARAKQALEALGLAGFERTLIGALSAGQLQRALFARLVLQNAKVILLDEPFAAIDARTTAELMGIVQRWHREKRTVVAVLHNFELVRSQFPETLLMAGEMIGWGPTSTVMSDANLMRARALVESLDEDDAAVLPLRRNAA